MTLARIVGTVSGDAANLLIGRDQAEDVGQNGRIAEVAAGELYCSDFQRFLVDPEVNLAPNTALLDQQAYVHSIPFTLDLDPGAVDPQAQCALRSSTGDVHGEGSPAALQRVEIWHRPIQSGQLQKTFDDAYRLPEPHTEESFHRQTGPVDSDGRGRL